MQSLVDKNQSYLEEIKQMTNQINKLKIKLDKSEEEYDELKNKYRQTPEEV